MQNQQAGLGSGRGQPTKDSLLPALVRLGQQLSAATSPREAAAIIADVADSVIGWDAFFLTLYDAAADRVRGVLYLDLVDGQRGEVVARVPSGEPSPIARRVIDEGPLLLLRDGQPDPLTSHRFGDEARQSASLLYVPVRRGPAIVGILSAQSYTPRAYGETHLRLLEVLADHCGGALERIAAQAALRESEERFRVLFEHSPDAIFLLDPFDPSGRWPIVDCNAVACMLNGYGRDELIGQSIDLLRVQLTSHEEDSDYLHGLRHASIKQFESRNRTKDGQIMEIECAASLITLNGRELVLEIDRNITTRKQTEQQLAHDVIHDALTGLPNRALFLDRLIHAVERAQRRDTSPFAVLFLDLDRFKAVNDNFGHLVGDQLLIEVGRRLQSCVRPGDTVARLSGDEFALLLDDLVDGADAARIADRILDLLAEPIVLQGHEIVVSTSIGVALSSTGYTLPEEMLRDADTALYRAKALGRARYTVFDERMHIDTLALLQLEGELREAIDRDQLRLHFQPILACDDAPLHKVEALVHWQHPRQGLLSPARFILLAEETGLIIGLGGWVLRAACRQLRAWDETGLPGLTVAVNLSARQLRHPGLVPLVTDVLRETGLAPHRLELELGERCIMDDIAGSTVTLRALHELGVRLAMDDFGTGFSSLTALRHLPLATIKIDRALVNDLTTDPGGAALVAAMIAMAHHLGLQVTAEGVETSEQLRLLCEYRCDTAQGFLFSPPLPSDELHERLRLAGAGAPASPVTTREGSLRPDLLLLPA